MWSCDAVKHLDERESMSTVRGDRFFKMIRTILVPRLLLIQLCVDRQVSIVDLQHVRAKARHVETTAHGPAVGCG